MQKGKMTNTLIMCHTPSHTLHPRIIVHTVDIKLLFFFIFSVQLVPSRPRRCLQLPEEKWSAKEIHGHGEGVHLHFKHWQPGGHGGPQYPQFSVESPWGFADLWVCDGGDGQDTLRRQGRNAHTLRGQATAAWDCSGVWMCVYGRVCICLYVLGCACVCVCLSVCI